MNFRIFALIAASACVVGLAIVACGLPPTAALSTLIHGSLGSGQAVTGSLRETTPLLIAGLAVFLALRAGLFNIGVEGQLTVGALSCAVLARGGGVFGVVLGLLGGIVAGGLWAWPAAWIKAYRNGHEVITTIMLNSVAGFLTTYLAAGIFKAHGSEEPSTESLPASCHLPNLMSSPAQVNLALLFGLCGVGLVGFWLRRTVAGFEFRAVGANPSAAVYAGATPRHVTMQAMCLSGAIAGLAGAIQVLAYEFRFYEGFSPGYGFDALGVALLAGRAAWALIPASLLFGVLAKGGTALQIEGVPKGITTVILGLIILIAAAFRFKRVEQVA